MGRYNDPEHTLPLIDRHSRDLAAIILEPMMGGGGCIPADREFLQSLRDATARHGILLIFDEVMTSRLAPGGLQGKWQILPDLSTFGKYLGGGMSFGAFGGRADLMRRFDPSAPDPIPHSGTYNNNVLSMAAGAAGLSKVFLPETADTLSATGETLKSRLNALGARHDVPLQVTGIGSILCLHFQHEPIHRPDDTAHTPPAARALCHLELLARNIHTARRGFLTLSLPLTPADYDTFVAAFDDFLAACGPALANARIAVQSGVVC